MAGAASGARGDPEGQALLDPVASQLAAALREALQPAVLGASLAGCPCLPLELLLRLPAAGDRRRAGRSSGAGTARVWVGGPSQDPAGDASDGDASDGVAVTVGRPTRAAPAALVVDAALDDLPDLLGDARALAVAYMQGRIRLEGRTGAVLGLLGWWTGTAGEPVREILGTHLAGSSAWVSVVGRRADGCGPGSAGRA